MEQCLICRVVIPSSSSEVHEEGEGHDGSSCLLGQGALSGLDKLEQETQAYYFLHELMSLSSQTCARLMRSRHDDDGEVGTFLSSLFDLCGDCKTQYLVEGRRIFDQIQRLSRQHNELKDTILTRMRIKAEVNDEEIHPEELSFQAQEKKRRTEELRVYLLEDDHDSCDDNDNDGLATEASHRSSWHPPQESIGRNQIIQRDTMFGVVDLHRKEIKGLTPAARRRTGRKNTNVRKKRGTSTTCRARAPPRPPAKKVALPKELSALPSKMRKKALRIMNLPTAAAKGWVEKRRKGCSYQRLQEALKLKLAIRERKNKGIKVESNDVDISDAAIELEFTESSDVDVALESPEDPHDEDYRNESSCDRPGNPKFTQWICYVCDEPIKLGETREDHVRSEHMDEEELTCPGCKVIFAKIKIYSNHVQTALDKDPNSPCYSLAVRCYKCGLKNKTKAVVRNSEAALEVHNQVVHNRVDLDTFKEKRRASLTCPKCQRVFKWKSTLTHHILAHDSVPVKCTYPNCTSVLKGEERLKTHIRLNHRSISNEWMECPTCGKKLKKRYLRRHQKLHMDTTPYLCSECGKGYKVWDQLRVHMWTHDKVVYREKYDKYKENAKRRKLEAELKNKTDSNNETEQSVNNNNFELPCDDANSSSASLMEPLSSINVVNPTDNSTTYTTDVSSVDCTLATSHGS